MNLQAKLTLGYVLLAVFMVGIISAVDLGNNVQQLFESTLERADVLNPVATQWVQQTLNSQLTTPLRVALRDPNLATTLIQLVADAHAILEIAVVDPASNDILADSAPGRIGEQAAQHADFRQLVTQTGWLRKVELLLSRDPAYYQLQRSLATPTGEPVLYVRVIIHPALIRNDMLPALTRNAEVAVVSVIGAFGITFLFSTIAFRPLGRLKAQLDLLAKGEYEPEKATGAAKVATDELSVMASKVSLLGQRLRGAQFEVSDLRGNIDRLLQDLEDAVFIFNRERNLIFASGSVEKFLGRERSDMAGQGIADIFPASDTLGLLIAQASQTGRPIRNRRVPIRPASEAGGGLPVVLLSVDSLETLPGGSGTGSGLLVRLRDPEAERKIGRELQTADRLAAISRVTSGVAHEVKNPLNAILLHVEVAKAKLARGDTEVEPQMEIISREILRLDRVVKTFLDFTRPVELKLSEVPVQELLGEVVDLARPQAGAAKILVNVDQQAEGVEVRVDRDLLKQAMLNVVVNAIEAMPEGGELTFQALAGEDTAEIRISDTGRGIPPELREKIFRLYFTTRKEGSGIGLAMTFRIVQLHDGTIDFTSEPGKGTTFFIRLPIAG
jgi:signal transduction histidine kinase